MKERCVTVGGTVVGVHRNSAAVELSNGSVVRGIIAGKLMLYKIRVLVGDKVLIQMSPYDLTKGRIIWRDR